MWCICVIAMKYFYGFGVLVTRNRQVKDLNLGCEKPWWDFSTAQCLIFHRLNYEWRKLIAILIKNENWYLQPIGNILLFLVSCDVCKSLRGRTNTGRCIFLIPFSHSFLLLLYILLSIIPLCPSFPSSAQELSQEIKSFISGVDTVQGRKLSVREHARCAVRLLRSVPACRGAVLEHLRGVYDEHVSTFLHNLETEGDASSGVSSNLEDIIQVQ